MNVYLLSAFLLVLTVVQTAKIDSRIMCIAPDMECDSTIKMQCCDPAELCMAFNANVHTCQASGRCLAVGRQCGGSSQRQCCGYPAGQCINGMCTDVRPM